MEKSSFFEDGHDTAYFINELAQAAGLLRSSPIFMYTDNRLLHNTANTTTQVADCRLHVEISSIREQQDNGEVSSCWISKESNWQTV